MNLDEFPTIWDTIDRIRKGPTTYIIEIIGRNNSWDAAENIGAEICAHIGRELDMIAVKHP